LAGLGGREQILEVWTQHLGSCHTETDISVKAFVNVLGVYVLFS